MFNIMFQPEVLNHNMQYAGTQQAYTSIHSY